MKQDLSLRGNIYFKTIDYKSLEAFNKTYCAVITDCLFNF